MLPALGEDGNVTVTEPLVVFTKNPEPFVAVKGLVFAVVHQLTVPVLPNPVCVAPHANCIVVPDLPNVSVLPVLFSIVFTLIVLMINFEIYILSLLYLIHQLRLL